MKRLKTIALITSAVAILGLIWSNCRYVTGVVTGKSANSALVPWFTIDSGDGTPATTVSWLSYRYVLTLDVDGVERDVHVSPDSFKHSLDGERVTVWARPISEMWTVDINW